MNKRADVSVIVPTMAAKSRTGSLKRAVDSIRQSTVRPIQIIVVVNGAVADADLCAWLNSQADIHFERIATPSSPLAVLHGRRCVTTPYFSFLNDDDEYLNGGTDLRFDIINHDASIDVVITSGMRCCDGVDTRIMSGIEAAPQAPLEKLFDFNWLASCNALFRTASFDDDFFADPQPYLEWTWLAFKMALAGKKIAAMNTPTFRVNDTAQSLSKQDAYFNAHQRLYARMLAAAPPSKIARTIRARCGADWHHQSVRALQRGDKLAAFTLHLKSLVHPGGAQYVAYTRRMLPFWPS